MKQQSKTIDKQQQKIEDQENQIRELNHKLKKYKKYAKAYYRPEESNFDLSVDQSMMSFQSEAPTPNPEAVHKSQKASNIISKIIQMHDQVKSKPEKAIKATKLRKSKSLQPKLALKKLVKRPSRKSKSLQKPMLNKLKKHHKEKLKDGTQGKNNLEIVKSKKQAKSKKNS